MGESVEMQPKSKLDVALIGIVITLALQGGTAVWWAAEMNSRLHQLETESAPMKNVPADVRVLAVQMENLNKNVAYMVDKVDRLRDGHDGQNGQTGLTGRSGRDGRDYSK